jgi:peptide/nickel transport system permease protein
MIAYLIRRLIQALIVILLVTVVTFLLMHQVPNGARGLLGSKATPERIAALNHTMGLDKPIWVQYWKWLDDLLHGNFGYSFFRNQTVNQLLKSTWPLSVFLVLVSTVLAVIIAVPMGVIQAVRRNSWIDHTFTVFAFIFWAMPGFVLGEFLIEIFAIGLHWPVGIKTDFTKLSQYLGSPSFLVMPILTLAVPSIAGYSRYMRSAMLDQITQDYVRTATATGASRNRVLYGHALRNALIPMVTLLGLSLPLVIGGSLVVEIVFNIQGLGFLTVQSANNTDFPTVMGITLWVTLLTVVGSLIADLSYAALDPRVRLD